MNHHFVWCAKNLLFIRYFWMRSLFWFNLLSILSFFTWNYMIYFTPLWILLGISQNFLILLFDWLKFTSWSSWLVDAEMNWIIVMFILWRIFHLFSFGLEVCFGFKPTQHIIFFNIILWSVRLVCIVWLSDVLHLSVSFLFILFTRGKARSGQKWHPMVIIIIIIKLFLCSIWISEQIIQYLGQVLTKKQQLRILPMTWIVQVWDKQCF